jgi:uroporphyrinogen-III synthase
MLDSVIVTASTGSFPGLLDALRAIPVAAEEMPLMTFAPPLDWAPVDAAARSLRRFEAVAFTSPRAARTFAERLAALGVAPTKDATPVWVAGAATAEALGDGLGTAHLPDERAAGEHGAAAALARAMTAAGVRGPVLFPCGDMRRDELPARLRDAGIRVEEVLCYRSVLAEEADARRVAQRARVIIVASPSVAELLARACPGGERPDLLAVGPTTADASLAAGWAPAGVATRPTVEALAGGVRALLAR